MVLSCRAKRDLHAYMHAPRTAMRIMVLPSMLCTVEECQKSKKKIPRQSRPICKNRENNFDANY